MLFYFYKVNQNILVNVLHTSVALVLLISLQLRKLTKLASSNLLLLLSLQLGKDKFHHELYPILNMHEICKQCIQDAQALQDW
jgi:hypothetical protein